MKVRVMYMGGASAGIIGSSDANNDIENKLKRSAIAFAQEYCNQVPNPIELRRRSEEVIGCLRMLQLTNNLSENAATVLSDELEKLMDVASAQPQ